MNQELYTIKDTVTGLHDRPDMAINRGSLMRDLGEIVNAKEPNRISTKVKDLQLYKIGEYNLLTGEITPCMEFICNLIDLKTQVGE